MNNSFNFLTTLMTSGLLFPQPYVGGTQRMGSLGDLSQVGNKQWSQDLIPHNPVWASLVAQMVKNLPAVRETWVQSLDWEDHLEKGMATHSSSLAWRIAWTEEPGRFHGITKSQTH